MSQIYRKWKLYTLAKVCEALHNKIYKELILAAFDDASKSGLRGTQKYTAPEVRLGHPATSKSDLWSLGCMVRISNVFNIRAYKYKLSQIFRVIVQGSLFYLKSWEEDFLS